MSECKPAGDGKCWESVRCCCDHVCLCANAKNTNLIYKGIIKGHVLRCCAYEQFLGFSSIRNGKWAVLKCFLNKKTIVWVLGYSLYNFFDPQAYLENGQRSWFQICATHPDRNFLQNNQRWTLSPCLCQIIFSKSCSDIQRSQTTFTVINCINY